eukprot:gi/632962146/ref/XP_007897147.1/ PREDICTED: uncharacterized protein LOC103182097 [Callorhinchus milii]
MERQQSIEVWTEKQDERKSEDKERDRDREKERDREKDGRRSSKYKETRKSDKKEGREKEEISQRRGAGEDVNREDKEEELKRKDYKGYGIDEVTSASSIQTVPSSHEDALSFREEKSSKIVKPVPIYPRGNSVELGPKVRSRDDKYISAQAQPKAERDSRAAGEKLVERLEKHALSSSYPELRYGERGSENHRLFTTEKEFWVDAHLMPSSRRPKYSYKANSDKSEEGAKHHRDKQSRPSSQSPTDLSSKASHSIASNTSNPDGKPKHRSASDKQARSETTLKESSRKRAETRLSPDVHLYMSELHSYASDHKARSLNSPSDVRAMSEHSKRKSRKGTREEASTTGSAQTTRNSEEEILNIREEKVSKTGKPGRETTGEIGSKTRSREDKYSNSHAQVKGERDNRGAGEKVTERLEKQLLLNAHQEMKHGERLCDIYRCNPTEKEVWTDHHTPSLSTRRPKYSYKATVDKVEVQRCPRDKSFGFYSTATESIQKPTQKLEYTVMSNSTSPEMKRKHIKYKGSVKDCVKSESIGKEVQNQQEARTSPDIELHMSKLQSKSDCLDLMPSGTTDASLPFEYSIRKSRKSSREKNSTSSNYPETWNGQNMLNTIMNKTDGYEQSGYASIGVKTLEGWGKGLTCEVQVEMRHVERLPESKEGSSLLEKKEVYSGYRASRRPRFSYGTNVEKEGDTIYVLSKKSSQTPAEPMLRITPKSEYMVSSTTTSPEVNRKLIKYGTSPEEQSLLSNYINKTKQLEITTKVQQPLGYEPSPILCSLRSTSPMNTMQQKASHKNPDYPGNGTHNISLVGHPEPSSNNSQERQHGDGQRNIFAKPYPYDLPDGDADREHKETSAGDAKLIVSPSSSSPLLHLRDLSSPGMTLSDGTLCVDIPRPVVSTVRKSFVVPAPKKGEVATQKLRAKPGHIKHQYHESQKRLLQTRKRYQEEVNAALMIQAAWKGYLIRAEIRKQSEAAIKIQAAYRGYQIRKFLTEGISEDEIDELNTGGDGNWQYSEHPDVFLEEISHSDYTESDAESTDDWMESPMSTIACSPGSYGHEGQLEEDGVANLCCANPLLQYESVYHSQNCTWGGI